MMRMVVMLMILVLFSASALADAPLKPRPTCPPISITVLTDGASALRQGKWMAWIADVEKRRGIAHAVCVAYDLLEELRRRDEAGDAYPIRNWLRDHGYAVAAKEDL